MGSQRHLLIVEDNPADVMLLQIACSDMFATARIDVVQDGEAALDFLFKRNAYEAATTPDLVLLDINLPKYSGFDVLQAVKNDPRLHALPIIILSSTQSQSHVDRAYQTGAACFIQKPSNLEQFETVLRKYSI